MFRSFVLALAALYHPGEEAFTSAIAEFRAAFATRLGSLVEQSVLANIEAKGHTLVREDGLWMDHVNEQRYNTCDALITRFGS
jgi:hypothetical protein